MQKHKILFILYSWLTVLGWGVVIFWFSSFKNLDIYSSDYSKYLEKLTYFFIFGFFLLLTFRALISTFRLTIDKLSYSRGKAEKKEDKEFVVIVETLLLTNAIAICTLVAIGIYHYLLTVDGRVSDTYSFLINLLGILVAALLTYTWPIINELEINFFQWARVKIRKLKNKN